MKGEAAVREVMGAVTVVGGAGSSPSETTSVIFVQSEEAEMLDTV